MHAHNRVMGVSLSQVGDPLGWGAIGQSGDQAWRLNVGMWTYSTDLEGDFPWGCGCSPA